MNGSTDQIKVLLASQGTNKVELDLLFDWGMDGTSGSKTITNLQSSTENEERERLKSLLVTQMCVVQISDKNTGKIIFTNPLVSCASAHRIVRMSFENETILSVQTEFDRVQTEIDTLPVFTPTPSVAITTTGVHALFDNKCKCYINDVGCSRCPNCGATQKEMSDPLRRFKNRLKVWFPYSPLHYLLRNFEGVMSLAAHNEFKKGRTFKGSDERKMQDAMMKIITKKYLDIDLYLFSTYKYIIGNK